MGKKEKVPKEDPNKVTEIDRTFYEITINDLNQKLSRLRSHLVILDETNVSLSDKLKEVTESRTDLVAHLERTVDQRTDTITELEERLVEIVRVRNHENAQSAEKIKELEMKYKGMHDQLTSEIKLLNGKLNSLEEFRIQRDVLMAKFDEQENQAKEKEQQHRELIYSMEQKAIVEKDELRKEMEVKLLQLSEDFTRCSEIRNAGYTKRLIRENIALQKEMNAMTLTQIKMQQDYEEHLQKNKEIAEKFKSVDLEKTELIRSSQNKIKIIEKLTDNYERLRAKHAEVLKYRKLYENLAKQDVCERFTINDLYKKLRILGQRVEGLKSEKKSLISLREQKEQENLRLKDVIQQVQIAIHIAVKSIEATNLKYPRENLEKSVTPDMEPKEITALAQLNRKNLLKEILHLISSQTGDLMDTLTWTQAKLSLYRPGKIGFLPRSTSYLMEILKRDVHSLVSAEYLASACQELKEERKNIPKSRAAEAGSIIDVQIGPALYISDSHEDFDLPEGEPTAENEDIEELNKNNEDLANETTLVSQQSVSQEAQSVERDTGAPPEQGAHVPQMSRHPSLPDIDDEAFKITLYY